MKPATNVFGERICVEKDCPAWFEDDPAYGDPGIGCFCEARMDFFGSIAIKDGKVQYGTLCKLPIEFKIVRRDGE